MEDEKLNMEVSGTQCYVHFPDKGVTSMSQKKKKMYIYIFLRQAVQPLI